jgi:hypothetical protein
MNLKGLTKTGERNVLSISKKRTSLCMRCDVINTETVKTPFTVLNAIDTLKKILCGQHCSKLMFKIRATSRHIERGNACTHQNYSFLKEGFLAGKWVLKDIDK